MSEIKEDFMVCYLCDRKDKCADLRFCLSCWSYVCESCVQKDTDKCWRCYDESVAPPLEPCPNIDDEGNPYWKYSCEKCGKGVLFMGVCVCDVRDDVRPIEDSEEYCKTCRILHDKKPSLVNK